VTMGMATTLRAGLRIGVMSLTSATWACGVWFAWKWGAHYAGVWWRGVQERITAGDTSINQASWFMRDRWHALNGVLDPPTLDRSSAIEMSIAIGVLTSLVLMLRLPGAVLAGWLGRRAIRRDSILYDAALARRLGRRVYADGARRWSIPLGIACGVFVALLNHLWQFGDFLSAQQDRMIAVACVPLMFLVADVFCSLRCTRHLLTAAILGRQTLCTSCGYDVTGRAAGNVCSECGKPVMHRAGDAGVRLVGRRRDPRLLSKPVLVVALYLFVAAVVLYHAMGVSDNAIGSRLREALLIQRTEPAVVARLPVGRVMEVRVPRGRMWIRVAPPDTPGWDRRRGVTRVRIVRRGAPNEREELILASIGDMAWSRTRITPGGTHQMEISVSIPTLRDPQHDSVIKVLTDNAECWLSLPRSTSVARCIPIDPSDPDMAWLIEPPPEDANGSP